MSQLLRLIGRKTWLPFTNTTDTSCLACSVLRNRYSTNTRLLKSFHSGKKKKKVKKKTSTDTEDIAQRKLELTQVLDRHVENLQNVKNSELNSGMQMIGRADGSNQNYRISLDKDFVFNQISKEKRRPSVISPDRNVKHSVKVTYKGNEELVNDKSLGTAGNKNTQVRKARRERKEPPNVSVHDNHFSEYSRDIVKKSFAFDKPKAKSKEDKPDITNTLNVLLNQSYKTLEESRAIKPETSETLENENESDTQGIVGESYPRYFVHKNRMQSKLLTQAETYKMEMARDKHLEKLDEPEVVEIELPDFLQEPASIEGQITKKAQAAQEKEREQQFQLEMRQNLHSQTPEDSLAQIMLAKKTQEFNADLRSYVDACVSCGMLDRALMDIKSYRTQFKEAKILTAITDVQIYNILLKGTARVSKVAGKKGNYFYQAKTVFGWIQEDGLKPTMESYCFSLLSLDPVSPYFLMMAMFIIKDMQQQGFDPRDAFNQCSLKFTEKDRLKQEIFQVLIPEYKATPTEPCHKYDSPLLESLNKPLPLSEVSQVNSLAGSLTADEALKQAETQFSREIDIYVKIKSIYPPFMNQNHYEQKIRETVEGWRTGIKEELVNLKMELKRTALVKEGLTMYPFLCLFPLDDYVHILTMEAQQMAMYSQHYSPQLPEIYASIAHHIHARYMVQVAQDTGAFKKLNQIYREYIENLLDPSMPCHNQRVTWKGLEQKFGSTTQLECKNQPEREWSRKILKSVGKTLMKVILKGANINTGVLHDNQTGRKVPCFYEVSRVRSGKAGSELMPHPKVSQLMHPVADLTFPTESLPMLCPPIPYTSSTFGGSLINTTDLVRRCSPDQTKMFKEMSPEAAPVFDSLNILSASAWQINKPVLSVAIQVFRQGGNSDIDIPILPSSIPAPEKPSKESEEDRKVMAAYGKQKHLYNKTFAEATSLWWTMLYKLSIANTYKGDTFWFPMNMDFRGRTYTVAPHLNHQGDDVNRGLIQFAKGKPLGEEGLQWLKIHLINLTGLKKRCSNKERLEYCEEIMPSIIDSADNPLTGDRWWMTSEEPWQTLAACMEIVNATRSGNPAEYVSKVPVHQDGSCNGLQHYAALGRDEMGAKSVNLHPLDVPSDVYTEVLELVKKEIDRDIRENTKDAKLAEISKEFIERKVIKQSVMTTVYGVTAYGARQQIAKQLKYKKIDEKYLIQISTYLTEKTFNSLNEMFTSAKHIQDWFNACAKQMSSLDMRMEWVTPLNFPVIQPYQKSMVHKEKTRSVAEEGIVKVDKRKQLNAFAPNFIHSLDATHMMLTALYCHRAGITFTSVHDCFWTHPAYIDVMNKITREQFVSLYQQPILEELSLYLIKKVTERLETTPDIDQNMEDIEAVLSAVPGTGKFELEKVLKSTYFFS